MALRRGARTPVREPRLPDTTHRRPRTEAESPGSPENAQANGQLVGVIGQLARRAAPVDCGEGWR